MKRFFLPFYLCLTLQALAQQKLQHVSTIQNCSNNSTFINAEGLNNNPNAIVTFTYDGITADANPHIMGVWYNGSQWAIYNQDRAPMPSGLNFNITWEPAGNNAFFRQANANTINNGKLIVDHPSINNNPNAFFYINHVWNPGGVGGIYNNSDILKEYDARLGRWTIQSISNTTLPDNAAFNFIVTQRPQEELTAVATTSTAQVVTLQNNNGLKYQNITDVTAVASQITEANLGFENVFFNWRSSGDAFTNQPLKGNPVLSDRVLRHMSYDAGGIGGDYWKGMAYPVGFKGNNWVSSFYENPAGTGGTGTLTSFSFVAEKRYLAFLLSGGADLNKLYVELQIKKSDWEAAWGGPRSAPWGETDDGFIKVSRVSSSINSDELFRYYFDLNTELNNNFTNKKIRIRIVDEKSGTWGHINTDDFIFKDNLTDFISLMRNGYSLLADNDKPVWGFADTHAHWMNHVGLKGLMHGTPGGNLETSNVLTDIPPCDGFNHQMPSITSGLLLAQLEKSAFNRMGERLADPGNLVCATFGALPAAIAAAPVSVSSAVAGAMDVALGNFLITAMFNPVFQGCGHQFTKDVFAKHYNNSIPNTTAGNYIDYPRWNTFFHQMMHISWVKRSYDGGQRMMVVPVGVAKSWEFNTTTNGVMAPPRQHIEEAVTALKQIVSQNNSWMEIAYTTTDARRIILSNKLAIIIGLEQAEVGNYFVNPDEEVEWAFNLGIRHIFPIHNINNKLGGAAVFNSALISYNDLVNRQSQNSPIQSFRIRNGYSNQTLADKSFTLFKFGNSFMRQGIRNIPIAGFGDIPFFYLNDVPAEYQYVDDVSGTPARIFLSHKNAEGLTEKGRRYITGLMKKGLVIDVDHMSDLSQDETMLMMQPYNYPMISGHTNFRELRAPLNGNNTSDDAKRRTENTIHDTRAAEINIAGGMFGLMTQQSDIQTVTGCPAKNNAPGGTPTFSQAYWYAYQKTGGEKGIAFGSDFNGFAPQTAPRFGVDAAATIEGDEYRNQSEWGMDKEMNRRRAYAFVQKNGVRYDSPINTWHYHRFLKPSFLYSEEREIWEALAMAKSGADINIAWQPGGGISVERTGIQQNKIRNLALGFRLTPAQYEQLDCPEYGILKGDCPAERRAAYMCVHGENSVQANWKDGRTMQLYRTVKAIYDLWMQFERGPNEPLRRSYAYSGGRDFDFNIDGLAHYGMFPDMIQDMKNIGLSPMHLRPLFLGAEQYIKMWEQAEAAKNNIRN